LTSLKEALMEIKKEEVTPKRHATRASTKKRKAAEEECVKKEASSSPKKRIKGEAAEPTCTRVRPKRHAQKDPLLMDHPAEEPDFHSVQELGIARIDKQKREGCKNVPAVKRKRNINS